MLPGGQKSAGQIEKQPLPLLIQRKLYDLIPRSDYKFVLIIENHSKGGTASLKDVEIAAVRIKHLNAFCVAHKHAAFAINSNRLRGPELSRLITRTTKPVKKFPFGAELENSASETTQGVNVSEAVNRDARIQLRSIRNRADSFGNSQGDVAAAIESHNVVVAAAIRSSDQS